MKAWLLALVVVVIGGAVFAGRSLSISVDHRPDVAVTPDMVTRGSYLVRAADCMVCHTREGGAAYAGGREFDLGGMGKLYTPNITPDKETGIGEYTDDDFRSAMQLGIGRGHKHLYPAFPYASYTLTSDEDVLAIKAYLFSLPPVKATPPPNAMKFPFNQRYLMAFWNTLYNPRERLAVDSRQSSEWNRGKYLVEALGHCGECHTPRGPFGGLERDHWLAGAPIPGAKGRFPNITPAKLKWSQADIVEYLSSGFTPTFDSAGGHMALVVENTAHLPPEDRAAIAAYLKIVPAQP